MLSDSLTLCDLENLNLKYAVWYSLENNPMLGGYANEARFTTCWNYWNWAMDIGYGKGGSLYHYF